MESEYMINAINSQDDGITYDSFLLACEFEATIGQLFIDNHKTNVNNKIIYKYVYCEEYYFKYNDEKCIWEKVKPNFINSDIESWLRSQYMILLRSLGSKIKQIETLTKTAKKILTHKFLKNVISNMEQTINDPEFFDKLNRMSPDYLPIKNNMVINLETGKQRDRKIEDYFSFYCDVEPVKEINQYFMTTIKNIMCNNDENLKYLQKIFGYCLTGRIDPQVYFIFHGAGSNGKSLLLSLLGEVLKKACAPISKSVIIDLKQKKGSNGSEIVALKDLRVGIFAETEQGEFLNEGQLKTISGGDKQTARAIYKEPIEFNLFLKLIVCSNFKPNFDGTDWGTARRIKYIPFDAKFSEFPDETKPNTEFKVILNADKILIKNHLNDFFTWCLQGAKEWYKDKNFKIIPQSFKDEQEKYMKEQNSFYSWWVSNIDETDEKQTLDRAEAYKDYTQYCGESGNKALIKKEFFSKMVEKVGKEYKKNGSMVYKNISLKPEPVVKSDIKSTSTKETVDFINNSKIKNINDDL
jgi:putative DNA primase/helicase